MSAPGYVLPSSTSPLPKSLTLAQFIQTVLVGLSGLPGDMVRPKWQPDPPKVPEAAMNWMAFGITQTPPDTFAYVGTRADGTNDFQRHERIEVQCSFYGPRAEEFAGLVRDGFQIQQNLTALRLANMGYADIDVPRHVPDLVHERWVNRVEQTIALRRQIQRVYPVPFLISAVGTIHTVVGNEEYLFNFETPEET